MTLEPNSRRERSRIPGIQLLGGTYGTEISLLLAIFVVVLLTTTINNAYIVKPFVNASEILLQTSLLGIFALGAAIVIISGGIDLSSGSVIAFSGSICASIIYLLAPLDETGDPFTKDLSWWILLTALLGTILVAVLIGTFHTWLITVIKLPPFVATLASLVGLRSLAKVLIQDVTLLRGSSSNTQIYLYDKTFRMLGTVWWIPLVIFLILSLFLWILMSRTVIGRHLYAMGGNEEAARLSGIRTDRLKWLAYCIGTVTASIAGILYTGYVGMSNPSTMGLGYELNAIAAAVVGGCSLQGGIGTILGTVLGSLFLRVVIDSVAKTVKAKPDDFQGLIVGILVVLAVAFNELRDTGGFRKKFFSGSLGILNVVILSMLGATIVCTMVSEKANKLPAAAIAGVALLLLLGGKAFLERQGSDSAN